jgi:hypothetical protein
MIDLRPACEDMQYTYNDDRKYIAMIYESEY